MAEEKSKSSSDLSHLPKHFHEDEEHLSQECKNLIATLPTEMAVMNVPIHQYNGFWFSKKHIQGILNFQNHYQSHDSDILLVTFPKAGTTWLKALTFTILNRKTYDPKPTRTPQNPHPLLTSSPHDLVPFVEYCDDLQKAIAYAGSFSSSSSPRLLQCQVPYVLLPESVKQSGCNIVYLCRNPKDLFVSSWKFMNKLLEAEGQGLVSIEDAFEKFCEGLVGYGPFWDHMLGYHKESLKSPEKVMFLRYEQLKSEPVRVVKNLAEFMGCGFSQEEEKDGNVAADILELCSFESLSNMEVNKPGNSWRNIENNAFFRRGEVGDWKNFFTFDMVQRLNVITEEKLEKHGLKF
ncbi:cytosolic sulfotransferase 5-like [Neltuma alba]|uniref:cytosolic sulfotransferase 5-like n=1 Tax=Neltuma alba TaxID=207710 RepID=UPI0010A4292D|nr:cytosolic sulfotransferase 5-like [Prosopis alba]